MIEEEMTMLDKVIESTTNLNVGSQWFKYLLILQVVVLGLSAYPIKGKSLSRPKALKIGHENMPTKILKALLLSLVVTMRVTSLK
jgi:hypothetical protein